ncbi:hypothetical protein H6P81_020666 [Aristolochia fimbriata]|uniref:C2HC zinc finger plants domain-containing protein n=1 Tax=Aristolochia fimbriata TaxID=158543 RepID=A0AAV7DYA2_ARIFI|nr:hypothetical protein H6P81_020666 [Aristolochia fimbriata]
MAAPGGNGANSDTMETDVDMEAETAGARNAADPFQNVRNLLALARELIDQGKPSLALQAVVMAMRSNGGEAAVFQTLNRAREVYRHRLQTNAAADELASLFAECAIAEAQPIKSDPLPSAARGNQPDMVPTVHESSILAESGRTQIVLDACADGSSFVCLQCGGLVSNQRKEEHLAYWCCGSAS